jgi:hypothetical protein
MYLFCWVRNGQSLHKTDSGPWSQFASERSAGAFGDGTAWLGVWLEIHNKFWWANPSEQAK